MSQEYVADVPYVRHFIPELSPQQLRLVAALNGVSPPSGEDFDYCELGCAHGDTLCALAAAHPAARFLGVDLNETHIASAKKLARDGALDNVGFLERDFSQLLDEDIGEFDFMVAHGVLSWVSPEKRGALIDLACAKLKPGGLLFVSYNAMPGWSAVEPLRQLLLSAPGGAGEEVDTLERARRGFAFAKALDQAGADYFKENPAAVTMLATMTKAGLPYVVHEYMHEHWVPMYFARVAWEMTARDLRFVGVLPLHLNFRETAMAPAVASALGALDDRLAFESLRDFATNEFFRRDVYVKGPTTRSPAVAEAYLETTRFIAPSDGLGDRTVKLPHRTIELDDVTFRVSRALAERPGTIAELAREPALAGVDAATMRSAVRQLLVAQSIVPLKGAAAPVRDGATGRYVAASSYNQMMLRRSVPDRPTVLASGVAGTAFSISALDALALRIVTEVLVPERAEWIHGFVARSVLRLRVGGQVIEDDAEQTRAITQAVEEAEARLGKLTALGLVAIV